MGDGTGVFAIDVENNSVSTRRATSVDSRFPDIHVRIALYTSRTMPGEVANLLDGEFLVGTIDREVKALVVIILMRVA